MFILKIWLHVDACIGCFVLPFMKKLGKKIPDLTSEFSLSLEMAEILASYVVIEMFHRGF
ncbi:MAG: hypothetical protein QXW74_02780 [Archaeoglobaceae archaeon]